MPSAQDVYITPASSVIDVYTGSTKVGYVSGTSTTKMVVSGATHLKIAASDDLELFSGTNKMDFNVAGTSVLELTGTTFRGGGFSGFGVGTWNPVGMFNVSGGATTLDNGGGYALYFKNAGTQYGAIDTYGGSLSIEAVGEAILSGASGIMLKGPGIYLSPTGTSAGDTMPLKFRELAANGTANVNLRAPDSIASDITMVLPSAAGTADQHLAISSVAGGVMTMGFADAGGGGGGGTIGGSLSDNYIPIGSAADTVGNFVLGLTENNSIWIGSDPTSTTSTAEYNTALGIQALDAITTADYNTAVGYKALSAATTGGDNVAIGGYFSLGSLTEGIRNNAIGHSAGHTLTTGNYNDYMGYQAGYENVHGDYNVGIGRAALEKNAPGDGAGKNVAIGAWAARGGATHAMTGSVFIGYASGYYTTGNANVAVGYGALEGGSSTYSANKNVAIGYQALKSATTAANIVAIGYLAGDAQTTDDEGSIYIGAGAGGADYGTNRNLFIGYDAGNKVTTGANNLAIGHKALEDNVTGIHNVVIGRQAGANLLGNQNVAFGTFALEDAVTQYYNTAIGDSAMSNSTGGDRNVAVGTSAMMNDSAGTGGSNNVAVGFGTLRRNSEAGVVAVGSNSMNVNTSGEGNTAVGYNTLLANTTGNYNTAIGYDALYTNVHGDGNIALGYKALYTAAPADGTGYNVAIGHKALYDLTDGVYNIALGWLAGENITTGDNSVIIGNNAGQALTTQNENVLIGQIAGQDLTGQYNTFIGSAAGYNATSADNNVLIGRQAGGAGVLTGDNNVVIGYAAGSDMTSAHSNVLIGLQAGQYITGGDENTVVGFLAGRNLSNGNYNTLMGWYAGYDLTSSHRNTFIGYAAGRDYNQTGDGYNVAIGMYAMFDIETGSANVAIGYNAMKGTNGEDNDYNVAIGSEALYSIAGGNADGTVAIGYKALYSNTTASGNTAVGYEAGMNVVDDHHNTFIGYQAGKGGASSESDSNVAIGSLAFTAITTADNSVAIGFEAGKAVTTGDNQVMIGYQAGKSITTGSDNVLIGYQAGESITIGKNNIAIGYHSMDVNVHGDDNIAIGSSALGSLAPADGGGDNVAIGSSAGSDVTTGQRNTIIGHIAGTSLTTGDGNVYIGQSAGPTGNESNKLYIHNAGGTPLIGGDFSSDEIYLNGSVGIGTTSPGFPLSVSGTQYDMAKIASSHSAGVALYLDADATGGSNWHLQSTADGAGSGGGKLDFVEAGTSRMIIAGGGKVGIGTTGPAEKLSIVGGNLLLGTNAKYIQFVNNGGTQFDALGYDGNNDLVINTPSDIIFKRNGTQNVRIKSNDDFLVDTDTLYVDASESRVGIGTTAPNDALDVRGNIQFSGSIYVSGSDLGGRISRVDTNEVGLYAATTEQIRLGVSNSYLKGTNWVFNGGGYFRVNSTKQLQFGDDEHYIYSDGTDLILKTVTTATNGIVIDSKVDTTQKIDGTTVATWTSTGLGIGTTTPQQKLHVEGGFRFRDGNSSSQRLEGYGWNAAFALVVSGTDALALCGGTPGVQFWDSAGNNHLTIIETGTNGAVLESPSSMYLISNDNLHLQADDAIQFLPDEADQTGGPVQVFNYRGGTEYVRFDGANQRVGIGTTAPNNALSVKGVGATSQIGVSSDGTNWTNIYNDSSDNFIIDPPADFIVTGSDDIKLQAGDDFEIICDDLSISNGSSNYVYFDGGNQRVGIGTTGPTDKLHVVGTTLLDGQVNFAVGDGLDTTINDSKTAWTLIVSARPDANVTGTTTLPASPVDGDYYIIAVSTLGESDPVGGTTTSGVSKLAASHTINGNSSPRTIDTQTGVGNISYFQLHCIFSNNDWNVSKGAML
jgi:hypothetical protein